MSERKGGLEAAEAAAGGGVQGFSPTRCGLLWIPRASIKHQWHVTEHLAACPPALDARLPSSSPELDAARCRGVRRRHPPSSCLVGCRGASAGRQGRCRALTPLPSALLVEHRPVAITQGCALPADDARDGLRARVSVLILMAALTPRRGALAVVRTKLEITPLHPPPAPTPEPAEAPLGPG